MSSDLTAGLSEAEQEAALLHRWPHLAQPGPQPQNRDVAGTWQEQLARACTPAPSCRERQRATLLELLTTDITEIALVVMEEIRR